MTEPTTYVGLDIAKSHIDAHLLPSNKRTRVPYDEEGVEQLIKFIGPARKIERIVLEATGGCEKLVLRTLAHKSYKVSMIQPLKGRCFARAKGLLAKTDKLDAQMLAEYAKAMPTRIYEPLCEEVQRLRDYADRRSQVLHMIVQEKNRLKQLTFKDTIALTKKTLKYLETEALLIEKRMKEIVKNNQKLKDVEKVLMTVKGVGEITAMILMAKMPELGKFNSREVAQMLGVAPINHDSGKMQGKRRTFGGRKSVKSALYMAALSAIQHDKQMKSFYNRLRSRGKLPQVALVAVIRKISIVLNARLRDSFLLSA